MQEKVNLDNFLLLCVIGKGSYAKVVLVKKKVILSPTSRTLRKRSP